jgi:hypothetical protein
MKKVTDMIDTEIAKIQYGKVQPITNNQIDLIFETMEKIDPDLKPLNVILSSLIKNLDDGKVKTLYVLHYLKFYGIGNDDILSIRPKYVIESNKLVKIPFLKKKHRESINILLDTLGIKGNLDE